MGASLPKGLGCSYKKTLNILITELNSIADIKDPILLTNHRKQILEDLMKQRNIVVTAADIGLGNVENTLDVDKPLSLAEQNVLNNVISELPSIDFSYFDYNLFKNYFISISSANVNILPVVSTLNSFIGNTIGGVYCPVQNNIYFASRDLSTLVPYIECNTGKTDFLLGSPTSFDFAGTVFSPSKLYIYFVPYNRGSTWIYLDCVSQEFIEFPAVVSGPNAYYGGVYSPKEDRIYFAPYNVTSDILFIERDETIKTIPITGAGPNAYKGAVYSPTQNRVYFIPAGQSSQPTWHYIDCNTGLVVTYFPQGQLTENAYCGGVYSPTQNRIYMIPYNQSTEPEWHYIDCSSAMIVAYTHATTPEPKAYCGGVYVPTVNKIYMVPNGQVIKSEWHYIDCYSGEVQSYSQSTGGGGPCVGGIYSPSEDKVYFCPETRFGFSLEIGTKTPVNKGLMQGGLFNKF